MVISKKRRNLLFLEAAILTFLIYSAAIFLTALTDNYRIDYLQQKLQKVEIVESSYFSQKQFDSIFLSNNCENMRENIFLGEMGLRDFGEDLGNFGSLFLENNIGKSKLNQRSFYLSELELYSQVLNYNEICFDEQITSVFYFFRESYDFDSQGAILEQFVLNQKNKTVVFSFDFDFEDDFLLNEIKNSLGVERTPFIRVGNTTLRQGGNSDLSLNDISVEFLRQRGELK